MPIWLHNIPTPVLVLRALLPGIAFQAAWVRGKLQDAELRLRWPWWASAAMSTTWCAPPRLARSDGRGIPARGFESHPLRQDLKVLINQGLNSRAEILPTSCQSSSECRILPVSSGT